MPLLASITLQGTFVTAILALPGGFILAARLIQNLWRLVRPVASRRQALQLALLAFAGLLAIGGSVVRADSDLRALTQQRLHFLQQAAPAFQRYHADTGRWPERPEALVPDYLPHWPDHLRIDPTQSDVKRVRYESGKGKRAPQIIFFTLRGPDATLRFNLADGRITRDR